MHNNAHANFVPDLDMDPSPAWSKPASALSLSNPLHHLPQSQQVRRLQQQIQQHRQLQHQQSQGGYGLGAHLSKKKKNNSGSDLPQQQHRHDRQEYQVQHPFGGGGGGGGGGGHQHISIKSDDMNSDDDDDDDDDEESNNEQGDRGNKDSKGNRGQQDSDSNDGEMRMPGLHHYRSLSHPQLTQGFTIPVSSGFAGFGGHGPTSPLSPGSPGSTTSETASITASMISPGLVTSSNQGYYGHHGHSSNNGGNNGLQGIESSLASLASLSVLSAAAGGSPTSVMPISMPMTSRGGRHQGNNMATTPTTSSFQPQSLPMMYHTGHNSVGGFMPTTTAMTSAGPHGSSFNAFSTALSQHFQRQQQQQQEQMASAALSSSLPVQSFSQFQQQQQQQQQHQLQQQQQHQQRSIQQDPSPPQKQHQRSRSKSLTISEPRIIPPTRVIPPRPPQTSAPRKYHGRQTRKLPSAAPVVIKDDADPTRRVAHIISEQKRREKINGGFDELKSVIPECAQNTDSKATILRKAVDYILLLEDELRKYTDVYQMEAGGEDPESSLEGHERER